MIIAASDEKEHATILQEVMQRARHMNKKFNLDKLQYKVSEVKYTGHIISHKGVQLDDDNVEAIVNMPPPEDRKSL
ncbi:uncharacterized protein K02A2.6-like [Tachysurus ichikawai]